MKAKKLEGQKRLTKKGPNYILQKLYTKVRLCQTSWHIVNYIGHKLFSRISWSLDYLPVIGGFFQLENIKVPVCLVNHSGHNLWGCLLKMWKRGPDTDL